MIPPKLAALSKATISLPGIVLISPVNGSVNERTRPEGLRILSLASRGAAPRLVRPSTKRLTCSGFGQNWTSCGISVWTYCSTIMRQRHYRATFLSVGEKVRREKALDFSGCKSRPGTGSLHPVAIEAGSGGNEAVGAFDVKGRLATP